MCARRSRARRRGRSSRAPRRAASARPSRQPRERAGVALAQRRRHLLLAGAAARPSSRASPAPAPPSAPVTATRSPGAAPSRPTSSAGSRPADDRERHASAPRPRDVAAGDRDAAAPRQRARPADERERVRALGASRGSPSARYASPGSAPIAARSDSAAASARWPISSGCELRAAEVDAVDHRVDRGDGVAARARTTAASSPSQRTTRGVSRVRAARAPRSARARATA